MIASFTVYTGKAYWFKLEGRLMAAALPVAYLGNQSEKTDITVDIESAPTKGGSLTSEMTAQVIKPGHMSRTDLPKVPSGSGPHDNPWCRISVTGSKNGEPLLVQIAGVGARVSGRIEPE